MRKTTAVLASSLVTVALATGGARAELVYEPDRVVDTRTGLVWLNVWQGEPLVNRNRLVEVAGGWRLATGAEIRDLFFVQFGVLPPLTVPPGSGPAFDPRVAQRCCILEAVRVSGLTHRQAASPMSMASAAGIAATSSPSAVPPSTSFS